MLIFFNPGGPVNIPGCYAEMFGALTLDSLPDLIPSCFCFDVDTSSFSDGLDACGDLFIGGP